MSDQPENLIRHRLDLIHRQHDRILAQFARFSDDLRHVKLRLTAIEGGLAELNSRVARMATRIDRIERQLDNVEAPAN